MTDPRDNPPEARGFTAKTPLHGRRVFTAGHLGMDIAFFVQMMRDHGIGVVADLRHRYPSPPHDFKPEALRKALNDVWIDYASLGRALRNRSPAPDGSPSRDEADYRLLLRHRPYRKGIAKVMNLMSDGEYVCLLCYHPNPLACHRDFLVGRTLAEKGAEIEHILAPVAPGLARLHCTY